ncbi:MAG: hypothetical protein HFE84_09495 [Lachnospiraceae bacterium]|nr:hypothetical protein [Lachnospiraceae bacterium]
MTKALAGILTAATVLSIGITTAFAACPGAGRNFVDADGNGVCDNYESICSYVDTDNDGICDNCGACHGNCPSQNESGRSYMDVDGDGICDNYTAGRARGRGNGFRGGCNR